MVSLQEKELELVRNAIDLAGKKEGKRVVESPEIKKIINIVEDFMRSNKVICYGGTAINNILPVSEQFYDKTVEIPDYDFFSTTPQEHAKNLADIYYKKGFEDVEAKSGMHEGTFKVFVNFIPVSDITFISPEFFNNINKDAIVRDGIKYCPPNWLRGQMYKELSRPAGDIARWEKVMKRLILLNKIYPLKGIHCDKIDYQRNMENDVSDEEILYKSVRDSFINQGVVFFGGFAINNYSKYMPAKLRKKLENVPDFDVLAIDAKQCATIVKEKLQRMKINNVKIVKHKSPGEFISEHYELLVDKETIAFIYQTNSCHSYNILKLHNKKIKIATIDTMLNLYLASLYTDSDCYGGCDRILCMCQFLFDVQQKNRLKQKGLLRRFTINCYGSEKTIMEMRAEKAKKYQLLKNKRGTAEYERYFFKYIPGQIKSIKGKCNTTKKASKTASKTASKKASKKATKKNKSKSSGLFKRLENLF